jgi:hypothetical protein
MGFLIPGSLVRVQPGVLAFSLFLEGPGKGHVRSDVGFRPPVAPAAFTLDATLSAGPRPMIRAHDLRLSGRELATEADVEALVADVREQLLEQIRAGSRIWIV